MITVEMPKANENMTEATLDHWLVKEGECVAQDQGLCEIITDKAKFELPSPAAGSVLKILAPERAVWPVGYILCLLGDNTEKAGPEFAARNEALLAAHKQALTALPPPVPGAGVLAPAQGVVRATPAARRLAREQGVDLAAVAQAFQLTGPVGEKDVKAYLERKA